MMRSAWRGVARGAEPKRSRSPRGPPVCMSSIAQQAVPNSRYQVEFFRPQLRRSSTRVSSTPPVRPSLPSLIRPFESASFESLRLRAALSRTCRSKECRGETLFIFQKRPGTTCRQARSFLLEDGWGRLVRSNRELGKYRPMTDRGAPTWLIGQHAFKLFLNSRKSSCFRARKMKEHPPTRAEAVKLIGARAESHQAAVARARSRGRARVRPEDGVPSTDVRESHGRTFSST